VDRIGVFLCYCKLSPLDATEWHHVLGDISEYPGVAYVGEYEEMCFGPGLKQVQEVIEEKGLDGVVLTSCSPFLHQGVSQQAVVSAGLEPYQLDIADISQGGWLATDGGITADRAVEVIKNSVDRLHQARRPTLIRVPVVKRALVIGGGIAGIQAALDIADGGYEVILVEKTSSIGGHMLQYSEVFPTLDCPQCIGTPKMVECGQHADIKILAYSEVEEVSGEAGNFTVRIRRKASYVDWDKCTGCGLCQQKCATKSPSEYERWIPFGPKKAIYVPFAQAVPNKPVIDKETCRYFTKGKCGLCEMACPVGAIDFNQQDIFVEENVGAIVVATGFELMRPKDVAEYDEDPDIIDGIAFERILCPGGPTAGVVKRPSDSKSPKEVVFVSCVGSRDPEHGVPYCSRVCCMYLVKMALLYKHVVHDGQAYIFYMDIRSTGKGYEEFVQRAVEDEGVLYLRGKVSRIFREGDKIRVLGADTLAGKRVEISCDLVILGMAMIARPETKDLAQKLGIATDEFGFITEVHPKLRPLETSVPGIFVAGTAQGPKDIPDSVAQGSGAAGKVLVLFSKTEVEREAVVVG